MANYVNFMSELQFNCNYSLTGLKRFNIKCTNIIVKLSTVGLHKFNIIKCL